MKVHNFVQLLYATYVTMRVSKTIVLILLSSVPLRARSGMWKKRRKKKIRALYTLEARVNERNESSHLSFSPLFFLVCTRRRVHNFLPSD